MTWNRRRAAAATLAAATGPWWLGGCNPKASSATPITWAGSWVGTDAARGHLLRDMASRPKTNAAITRRTSVVIVGAGVAGLTAARALHRAGVDDFVVLELEDVGGGNARAHTMGGMACPLGAHYLPVPDDRMPELRGWLSELGLMTHQHGRWRALEKHLCHAPQERLWFEGQWVEGLLAPAAPGSTLAQQYLDFEREVAEASKRHAFVAPTLQSPWTRDLEALDAVPFAQWLSQRNLTDEGLLAYLDYACRDDYGAGIATVSAWAGLHYFASRHGFKAPGASADADRDDDAGVFTWPEGNAWLTQKMTVLVQGRLRTGHLVTGVTPTTQGVWVDAIQASDGTPQRWLAQHVIVASPLHVAARIVQAPITPTLQQAAAAVAHAPWLVANLHVRGTLDDRQGAAPAWDNVLFSRAGSERRAGVCGRHASKLVTRCAATQC